MIGYVTLGTTDVGRTAEFYDPIIEALGGKRLLTNEREAYWGHDPAGAKFAVVLPFDGKAPAAANGSMVALRAKDHSQVEAAHKAALAQGATDEGAPGGRGEGSFYAGYFRDLDGHKICVFTT